MKEEGGGKWGEREREQEGRERKKGREGGRRGESEREEGSGNYYSPLW